MHGKKGTVYVDSTAVGKVVDFDYEDSADLVDDSGMGEDESYEAGQLKGRGNITVRMRPSDAGQQALVPGAKVTLSLYPEGNEPTNNEWTGEVSISSRGFSISKGSNVDRKYAFQGVLTEGTVSD
ncbi:MAG: hypothetical protein GY835_05720 [bacterium]|nr:hypothetical protein [bacterium]